MTHYVMTKCTQNLYTVCPSEMVLSTAGCRTIRRRYFWEKLILFLKSVIDLNWMNRSSLSG